MPDMEKVIKGLKCLAQKEEPTANPCKDCGYSDRPNYAICVKDIASDALELLIEQKGVPYVFDADGETVCGVCGYYFGKAYSNCPKCGKKVDWNG